VPRSSACRNAASLGRRTGLSDACLTASMASEIVPSLTPTLLLRQSFEIQGFEIQGGERGRLGRPREHRASGKTSIRSASPPIYRLSSKEGAVRHARIM
jgi:hypothetical protein